MPMRAQHSWRRWWCGAALALAGCATPQYAIRPTPVPVETPDVQQFERAVSDIQARQFTRQGARELSIGERVWGFDPQEIAYRLAQVSDRPGLRFRVFVAQDQDPNAAALPDGRIFITTGMLNYLASRGSVESELAFVLSHEIAHTAAQHLVKRAKHLQQQQLIMGLVGLGAAVASRQGGRGQQVGGLANSAASLANQAILSGYSQEDELEADQLGLRYFLRAGYDPGAAMQMLEDFSRLDAQDPSILVQGIPVPAPFLRTHPYTRRRLEDVRRYLQDLRAGAVSVAGPPQPVPSAPSAVASTKELRVRLREAQQLYPAGSQSWQNIQRQLDALGPEPVR